MELFEKEINTYTDAEYQYRKHPSTLTLAAEVIPCSKTLATSWWGANMGDFD